MRKRNWFALFFLGSFLYFNATSPELSKLTTELTSSSVLSGTIPSALRASTPPLDTIPTPLETAAMLADMEEALATEEPEVITPALRELADENFQTALRGRLMANPTWSKLIRQGRMAVGVVDMNGMNGRGRFGSVNGESMMYAASLPKIAVLAAAMDAMERGEMKMNAAIDSDLGLMIRKSNNQATTRMIDRVGYSRIERTMTDPRYQLYDPEHGGGLWVGKRYAAGGARNPDPMKGLSHAATVDQICRFYYMVDKGMLVSPERSEMMKKYLVDPGLHHKFVNTLDQLAPNAKFYRKSGSWKSFHSDSIMVKGPNRNYILTALIDDPSGEIICRQLAKVIDDLLKQPV
ncbi:MAG: serine hydrolase [Saprospiraceae bacterium]